MTATYVHRKKKPWTHRVSLSEQEGFALEGQRLLVSPRRDVDLAGTIYRQGQVYRVLGVRQHVSGYGYFAVRHPTGEALLAPHEVVLAISEGRAGCVVQAGAKARRKINLG